MLELDPLVGKAHISLWGVNAAAAGNGGGVPIIAEREETGIVVDTVTLCVMGWSNSIGTHPYTSNRCTMGHFYDLYFPYQESVYDPLQLV